jgi:hypothetical protein
MPEKHDIPENRLSERYERFRRGLRRHTYLSVTDNSEVIADGCTEILRYDDNLVILRMKTNAVSVTGFELKLSHFSNDGVLVRGKIASIEFKTILR